MKTLIFSISFVLFIITPSLSQETIDDILNKFNKGSVPYMTISELTQQQEVVILDAREKQEFDISHIKDARYVGYSEFDIDSIRSNIKNKDQKIVVYCTLGVRSEDIAEKIIKAGYTNVYNLYGGIIEWKNKDLKVIDNNNLETEKIHVFTEFWSKWLTKGIKIYD